MGVQIADKLSQSVTNLLKLTDEVDYTFNYKKTVDTKTGYDYGFFLFGNHDAKNDEGMQVMLHADTALAGVAIPNKQLDANFDCVAANGCIAQTASEDCPAALTGYKLRYFDTDANALASADFLNPTAQTCTNATTFMRWTNSSLTDSAGYATNMNIKLFSVNNTNLGDPVGLLGLAPNSEFFTYITGKTEWNKNDDQMQFGLSYSPNSGASKLMDTGRDDIWKQNQFIIKGKRNGGDISFYSDLVNGATTWTVGNANFTIDDDNSGYTPTANVQVCLSSSYPYMVGMADTTASNNVIAYYNKVCDSNPTTNCPEKDAKKDQVKKARINLANNSNPQAEGFKHYSLTLETEDILFWNGNNFMSIVGQPVSAQDLTTYGCESTAAVVLGRPFLSKYEAVMQIDKKNGNAKSLAFVANEGTSSIFLIILIILGCIILAICIAIILLKVCKRKSNDEGEYNKADN